LEFSAPGPHSLTGEAHLGALSERALGGFPCLESACGSWQQDKMHREWLWTASVQFSKCPELSCSHLQGSRSRGENVLQGGEGAEGKKVGAVFPVPGRVRSSRDTGNK